MIFFVPEGSIVRKIWGKSDTVLFIFAGASAEFALNKAVDWLYFTGRLPADPIGRLFSTVSYAQKIVFAELESANRAIDQITAIHAAVESNRGARIPEWAYRDVLFMLIHYSIASFELLETKLSPAEKEEVFNTFYKVGSRMGLQDLPTSYIEWLTAKEIHLQQDLAKSDLSLDLFGQYKKHLGTFRFNILKEAQILVVPTQVRLLLGFGKFSWLSLVLPLYKLSRTLKMDWIIKKIILPKQYRMQIKSMDLL